MADPDEPPQDRPQEALEPSACGRRLAGHVASAAVPAAPQGLRLRLSGTELVFPFPPYDVQKAFMAKMLRAMDKGGHALLESPTGTGKTLSLLVAALAWQKKQRATPVVKSEVKIHGADAAGGGKAHTIIYASRTHAQLSQVVRELKRTDYTPTIALLASREQLCVKAGVRELRGKRQAAACGALVHDGKCGYKIGLDSHVAEHEVLDVEELVSKGTQERLCPFYLQREAANHADLVLAPYSYLLTPQFRRGLTMDFEGAIVIFDEAHNLEAAAAESASFEVNSLDVAGMIREVDELRAGVEAPGYDPLRSVVPGGDLLPEELDFVKVALLTFEDQMLGAPLAGTKDSPGITMQGEFIFAFLKMCRITAESAPGLLNTLSRAQDMYYTMKADLTAGVGGSLYAAAPSSSRGRGGGSSKSGALKLELLAKALQCIFRPPPEMDALDAPQDAGAHALEVSKLYQVHICETDQYGKPLGQSSDAAPPAGRRPRMLAYWCFSPSVALKELSALGVRSCIVTSGTLAPLPSFGKNLGVPFEEQLSNKHVVPAANIFVGICGTGPRGRKLSSSFRTRSTPEYKEELGATLLRICQLAPGGILVFFPSFSALEECRASWEARGVLRRLKVAKSLFVEPRGRAQMGEVISGYEAACDDRSGKGAVLFGVCRGKASEGVDFRDHRARLVIVTGIPFAPIKDPRVQAQRGFLDQGRANDPTALSGQAWYNQSAARAVNQAIGRAIRHARDWGAMLILDDRFLAKKQQEQLTSWVRRETHNFENFGCLEAELGAFFDRLTKSPGKARARVTRMGDGKRTASRRVLGPGGEVLEGREGVAGTLSQVEGGYVPQRAATATGVSQDLGLNFARRGKRCDGTEARLKERATPKEKLGLAQLLQRSRSVPRETAAPEVRGPASMPGSKRDDVRVSAAAGPSVRKPRKSIGFGLGKKRHFGEIQWEGNATEPKPKTQRNPRNIEGICISARVSRGKATGLAPCNICCKEGEPLVARCGHVACRDCWTQWVGKKAECFSCRAPVAAGDLRALRVEPRHAAA